jgi:hypothetical protein
VFGTWVINTHCIPAKLYYKGRTIIWVPFVIYRLNEKCLNDLTVEISNKRERTQKVNNKQINQQTLQNVCKRWRNKKEIKTLTLNSSVRATAVL